MDLKKLSRIMDSDSKSDAEELKPFRINYGHRRFIACEKDGDSIIFKANSPNEEVWVEFEFTPNGDAYEYNLRADAWWDNNPIPRGVASLYKRKPNGYGKVSKEDLVRFYNSFRTWEWPEYDPEDDDEGHEASFSPDYIKKYALTSEEEATYGDKPKFTYL